MQTFISYLQDVLGVKAALMPEQKATAQLLVLTGEDSFSADEKALLEKMIQALKLNPEIIEIQKSNTDISSLEKYKAILCFDQKAGDWLKLYADHLHLVVTHGPHELIKKAELKKQAWTDMQKVLNYLN